MSRNRKKHIDFSVIIPTYNRSNFLKLSILSALRQKDVSLEVIVIDDCSTDDTKELVESLRDKRIKYWKNKNRVGTSQNFINCFRKSSGNYIFTLGDDDFILDSLTLNNVLAAMKKNKVGMGKIGTITYENSYFEPYQVSLLSNDYMVLKPNDHQNILIKSINFGLGFYSGLIFDNNLLNRKYLNLDHACYPDHMCHSYHRVAYDLISRYGIAYVPNHFIVSRLSLQLIPRYFSIAKHGRLYWEDPIFQADTFLKGNDFIDYKRAYIRSQLVMLPNIKYFSDNWNYLQVLQKIREMDTTIMKDMSFLFWASMGFMPKWIIEILRKVKIWLFRKSVRDVAQRYDFNNKIQNISRYFDNHSQYVSD